MNTTAQLADALRASVASLDYAVMALQAPEKCAMREDLDKARAALAAYDAEQAKPRAFGLDSLHTPEPWRLAHGARIESEAGRPIAETVRTDDAVRIVVCVNACAGFPDPSGLPAIVAALNAIEDITDESGDLPAARAGKIRAVLDSLRTGGAP